jgi:hypothetical protein
MPEAFSAAGVARAVSKKLRKAGFLMADTSDRYRWTEGYHVSRVGYSNLVSVDYHVPRWPPQPGKAKEMREKVRTWLREQGYTLNDTGYIICKGD